MDIAILINEFLSDKKHLVTENDSINIVENQISRWDFLNIPQPSNEELQALAPVIESRQFQYSSNKEAQAFLDSTDWKVLRHRDQQELGIATSMTGQEFQDLLQQRQMAREAIQK